MNRAIWRWGAAAVLAGALVGCAPKSMVRQKPPPPDPLLVTRKPIEGKPRADDSEMTARLQPPAPPADGLASGAGHDAASPVRPANLRVGPPTAP